MLCYLRNAAFRVISQRLEISLRLLFAFMKLTKQGDGLKVMRSEGLRVTHHCFLFLLLQSLLAFVSVFSLGNRDLKRRETQRFE